MVSGSTPHHREKCGNLPKSHFQQTVCLSDWWLIKAENDFQGSRLAVAGFSSREKQALRVFSSAPILERYDVLTIETSDGICVILKGFLNKARTLENGFPSDVCNHFVCGFPPYWKDYNEKFVSQESSSGNISGVNFHKKRSPQSEGGKLYEDSHEGGKLYEDSHENDLGSQQDGMNAKVVQEKEKPISVAVRCPQISDHVVSEDKINTSSISRRVHEQESYTEVPNLKTEQNSNKKTARISGVGITILNSFSSVGDRKTESASPDCVPGGRTLWNSEGGGFRKHVGKRQWVESEAGSSKDEFELNLETPRKNEYQEMIKTKGKKQNEKVKPTRQLRSGVSMENHKQKVTAGENSLSENAKASGVKTRRMAYETPHKGQEKACAASCELVGFTRSRSGRLLMPTMEFWRNERVIYDADRTVTGIQGSAQLNKPRKGSRSEPPRRQAKRNIS